MARRTAAPPGRNRLAVPAGEGTPISRRHRRLFTFEAAPQDFDREATRRMVTGVSFVPQLKNNWCWAACAQMVFGHHGIQVTQSLLATKLTGTDCDAAPNHPNCDKPCGLEDFRSVFSPDIVPYLDSRPISEIDLQQEIEMDHPVQIGFTNGVFDGHVALVVGWSVQPMGLVFTYYDPKLTSEAHGYYQDLLAGNPFGTWQYTWTGL